MSKIKPQVTITHTPSFRKYRTHKSTVIRIVEELDLDLLYRGVHTWYWYTDIAGVAKLLPNLLLRSDLYKKDIFTCINYAFKVWNKASSRFGLNTWIPVIGRTSDYPTRHAWNLILVGDKTGLHEEQFLFFEPNGGWEMGAVLEVAGQAFPIGEEGYQGEMAFL